MADDAPNETNDPRTTDDKESTAPRDDVAVTLMGSVLEKLRILAYERELGKKKNSFTPFTETQFAVLQGNNASAQFKAFLDLVLFLMKQSGQHDFVVDKYDDPNSSVNKLVLALKVMGFPLDFPASKLKLAYGEPVCAALDFLCDRALAARNFSWARPAYPKEDFADEAEADDDAEIDADDVGGAAASHMPHSDDDDDDGLDSGFAPDSELHLLFGKRSGGAGSATAASHPLEESYQQMIVSQVDPLLWKTELERVGPRLKLRGTHGDDGEGSVASTVGGHEWHTHIERTRKHHTSVAEWRPRATTQLSLLATQLRETIDKMASKEKLVNNQLEPLCHEFKTLHDSLQTASAKCKDDSARVDVMTNEHAAITEQLRDTKAVMDERGSKMTDTSPLVAIKDALKTLQVEIKNFELRIGVVGHTLLQAKARYTASGLTRKGAGGSAGYQDPEYDQSDDDSS